MTDKIEIQEFPLWDKLKSQRRPISFDLEVTARCNNDCRHCYINLPAADPQALDAELSLAEITQIAQQAADMGAVWCLLTGGEPLLRPDFSEIYLALKRMGLLVSVFTNATLVTPEHVRLFQKYPPRDIEITVYGATQATYEAVSRKAGTYARFIHGLDLLQQGGVRVRLKAMALRSNLPEMAQIAEFGLARTKDFYRFDPQLHLRYDGDPVRNAEIRQERLTPEEVVALERADAKRLGALQANQEKLINPAFNHLGCDHLFHCGAGSGSFSVSYDGKFRLCSALWAEGATYDLRQGTLKEAWEVFTPQVKDLRSQKQEFRHGCRQCELINMCLWCPAHAHLETGEMDGATPYFCQVAHTRAQMVRE